MEMTMKKKLTLGFAALLLATVAGTADAARRPGGGGGGGGGVPTNYGCQTFKAGSVFFSTTNSATKKTLLTSTYACYLCNMTTRYCTMQSPTSLVGWAFYMP